MTSAVIVDERSGWKPPSTPGKRTPPPPPPRKRTPPPPPPPGRGTPPSSASPSNGAVPRRTPPPPPPPRSRSHSVPSKRRPPPPPPRRPPMTTGRLTSSSTHIAPSPASANAIMVRTVPTPKRVPPTPPSPSLHFLSEEPTVPARLSAVEEASVRRRHEFRSHVHDLTCRVASLTASLAAEQMERDRELVIVVPEHLYQPLERLLFSSTNKSTAGQQQATWMSLENSLSKLNTHMTTSIHNDLLTADNRLRRLLEYDLPQVRANHQLELYKADKRHGSLQQNLQDAVGTLTRRFRDEQAKRASSLSNANSQVTSLEEWKAAEFLRRIDGLKQDLAQERLRRQAEDARLMKTLVARDRYMKEAMLGVVGDPTDSNNDGTLIADVAANSDETAIVPSS